MLRMLPIIVALAVAVGCEDRSFVAPTPSVHSTITEQIHTAGRTKVDLLFVVDTSASMVEEQSTLVEQIGIMARKLIRPSDAGAPSVEDIHVGIVTADVDDPDRGGLLHNSGRLPGCQTRYSALDCDRDECPWLSHSYLLPDDGTDPDNPPLWEDLACIAASLGTEGSNVEQPMEAAYMALVKQTEPGMPNEGFLRDGSLLVIIIVSDEDDCSGAGVNDADEPGVGCLEHEEVLNPVSDYHDSLIELRGGDANLVVVSAIVGIPIDGSWNPGDPIDELRELRTIDEGELVPSCVTIDSFAYYPVRLSELVYSFGNNGILESICRDDWTLALQAITRGHPVLLSGVCVNRPLAGSELPECRILQTMHDRLACYRPADRTDSDRTEGLSIDLGLDDEGRRVCEILPADIDGDGSRDGDLEGWVYEFGDINCERGKISFTDERVMDFFSSVRFECLTALCPLWRLCPEALRSSSDCSDGCSDNEVCLRHYSGEVCGWDGVINPETGQEERRPQSCRRCSPTMGSVCELDGAPEEVLQRPLLGPGGCCAEGFHCESGRCTADRTTTWCH